MPELEDYINDITSIPHPEHQAHWIEIRNKMLIHSQGADPSKVIIKRHAYEDEKSFNWRIENYVPITKPVFKRALSSLTRILNDSGYVVKGIDNIEEYLTRNIFYKYNFKLFMQHVVIPSMLEDPNGYLVWMPTASTQDEADDAVDENGYQVYKQNPEELLVLPQVINSGDIRFIGHDVFIFLSKEKSLVKTGGNEKYEGDVYYVLTKDAIHQVYQYGNLHEKNFAVINDWYVHNMNTIPATILGGDYSTTGYYESYFSCFVPFADEAIRQFSDWTVVMATSAYPIKEIMPMACDEPGCDGGIIRKLNSITGDYDHNKCHRCSGTGFHYKTGPFAAFIRPEYNAAMDVGGHSSEPMLRYITPPTEVIEISQKSWQILLENAEASLNLKWVMDAQSGVAKAIDRAELDAMLSRISANVYDNIMFQSLLWLNLYYGHDEIPQISKPKEFRTKTEDELQKDYNTYIVNPAAKNFAIQTLRELCDRKFVNNPLQRKIMEMLALYDPYFCDSNSTKIEYFAIGMLKIEDAIKSNMANNAILNIVYEQGDEWFIDASRDEIFTLIDAKIQPFLPKPGAIPSVLTGLLGA